MRECRLAYLEQIGIQEKNLVRGNNGRLFFKFDGHKIYLPKEFYVLNYFMFKVLKGTQFTP